MHTTRRLRFSFLFLIVIATGSTAVAQAPDSLWGKYFGGPDYDRASAVVRVADGGFAVAGEFGEFEQAGLRTGGDMWLVRTDAQGDELWSSVFGGPGIDEAYTVLPVSDDGFLLGGARSNEIQIFDAWLIRTDADGDSLWSRRYGERFGEEWITDIVETDDGGFAFTGVVNNSTSSGNDVWLVRIDADGVVLWEKNFGGPGVDQGNALIETDDGGFLVTGRTRQIGSDFDVIMVRTDASGDELWTRTYDSEPTSSSVDAGNDLIPMDDGGAMVLGLSHGVYAWMLRTDAVGDTLWTTRFFGSPDAFIPAADGGFIIAGGSTVQRTNASGELQWTELLTTLANDIVSAADGGFVVAGYALVSGSLDDMVLTGFAADVSASVEADAAIPSSIELLGTWPNPFQTSTIIGVDLAAPSHVTITVHDALGRRIRYLSGGFLEAGRHLLPWDGRTDTGGGVSSGVYFVRIETDGGAHTARVTKMG